MSEVALEVVPSLPRATRPGEAHVAAVDLRTVGEWTLPREEYAVRCLLDGGPELAVEALGEGVVVVHRNGGSYGPARFRITASADFREATKLRLTLISAKGVPLHTTTLGPIAPARRATFTPRHAGIAWLHLHAAGELTERFLDAARRDIDAFVREKTGKLLFVALTGSRLDDGQRAQIAALAPNAWVVEPGRASAMTLSIDGMKIGISPSAADPTCDLRVLVAYELATGHHAAALAGATRLGPTTSPVGNVSYTPRRFADLPEGGYAIARLELRDGRIVRHTVWPRVAWESAGALSFAADGATPLVVDAHDAPRGTYAAIAPELRRGYLVEPDRVVSSARGLKLGDEHTVRIGQVKHRGKVVCRTWATGIAVFEIEPPSTERPFELHAGDVEVGRYLRGAGCVLASSGLRFWARRMESGVPGEPVLVEGRVAGHVREPPRERARVFVDGSSGEHEAIVAARSALRKAGHTVTDYPQRAHAAVLIFTTSGDESLAQLLARLDALHVTCAVILRVGLSPDPAFEGWQRLSAARVRAPWTGDPSHVPTLAVDAVERMRPVPPEPDAVWITPASAIREELGRSRGQTLHFELERGPSQPVNRAASAPQLYFALDCAAPASRQARFSLAEVDAVVLARGLERSSSRQEQGTLRISVPDPWMSTRHARLDREGGRWKLTDTASKNGTYVNGKRIAEALLFDGDVIGLGNGIWVFREDVPLAPGEPADLEIDAAAERLPALATMSPELAQQFALLSRIAETYLPVLIRGDSGTGKEMTAHAVHEMSRRTGPFTPVNCGGLAKGLIESELFGVVKGAYTGATEDRPGIIRATEGGTLFLDEVAELPETSQASLLRVLQENEVMPVGGTRPTKVDVRVVAATHQDMERLMEAGKFRRDLYARLAGFQIALPRLADRREDLGLIAASLLRSMDPERAKKLEFEPAAAHALFAYTWPFNVRELRYALHSALALTTGDEIASEQLPLVVRESISSSRQITPRASDDTQRARLLELLERHRGNLSAVARDMTTSRSQIRRLARRFGIDLDAHRR